MCENCGTLLNFEEGATPPFDQNEWGGRGVCGYVRVGLSSFFKTGPKQTPSGVLSRSA